MDLLAFVGADDAGGRPAGGGGRRPAVCTINLFWIIVGAANFILFFALFQMFFAKPIAKMLTDRRARIEQGLADAEAARAERESSAAERAEAIAVARREAKEIIDRAQKVAQETREADIAATREELERLRVRAATDIEAEKQRALSDLRAEVADLALAAAGRVVGETMSDTASAATRRGIPARDPGSGGQGLMARSTTAARRYAEAAFEIALRDGTVEAWRRELDQAAEVLDRPDDRRGGPQPGGRHRPARGGHREGSAARR